MKGREHSQSQERDPELPCGEEGDEGAAAGRGGRCRRKEGKRLKKKGLVTKMAGLYRGEPLKEEQPRPWTRRFGEEKAGYSLLCCLGLRDAGRSWPPDPL